MVGSRTATVLAWAMASMPAALTFSRWLTACAPSSPASYNNIILWIAKQYTVTLNIIKRYSSGKEEKLEFLVVK